MAYFWAFFEKFIFSISNFRGPIFHLTGQKVAETNGAHPGSSKMLLSFPETHFDPYIFLTQSTQNIMKHPVVFVYY